jgi:hypothetical protein
MDIQKLSNNTDWIKGFVIIHFVFPGEMNEEVS